MYVVRCNYFILTSLDHVMHLFLTLPADLIFFTAPQNGVKSQFWTSKVLYSKYVFKCTYLEFFL